MKPSWMLALFTLLAGIASGSSLENMLREPDARVAWSNRIASLESGESRAIFTALIVERSTRRVQGVRIDFSEDGRKPLAVYIDEEKLQPLKELLDRLNTATSRPAFKGAWAYQGLCEFRDDPGSYPLHFDYRYSPWPALRITSPTMILFAHREPSDLAEIFAKAIGQLKGH